MGTIDWAVQGICLPLSVFLLYNWWKGDEMVRPAAKALLMAWVLIFLAGMIFWAGLSTGSMHQAIADRENVTKSYLAIVEEAKKRAESGDIPANANFQLGNLLVANRPEIAWIDTGLMSVRSLLSAAALFIVLNLVNIVSFNRPRISVGNTKDGDQSDG